MVLMLRMQLCTEIFRIHLKRFYGAYLFSKSANAIFKVLIDCLFRWDDFDNRDVGTSNGFQMNPKMFLNNTAFLTHLPCLASSQTLPLVYRK